MVTFMMTYFGDLYHDLQTRQDNVYSPPQNEYKNTNTISKDKKTNNNKR